MDSTDEGMPRPGKSESEIMIRPLFGYLLQARGITSRTRSFDLDGDDSTGYPEAAGCARAMQHSLIVAGHPCAILAQLWAYTAQGDKLGWQVEYRGQHDLGDPSHVQAMRTWAESGVPLAFIARLTGNVVAHVEAIIRPEIHGEHKQAKPRMVRQEPREMSL